jgi:hypothetical protein
MIKTKRSNILVYALLLQTLFCFSSNIFAIETVLINNALSIQDSRYTYPKKLLQRILDVTETEFQPTEVKATTNVMTRARILRELERGEQIHVMAEAPKPEWNARLLSVRIPIRKGIQGYRLFLIKKRDQAHLNAISSFDDFKRLPTGSGKEWSTTRVLEENQFNVIKGTNYEGLFGMLMHDRFTTFGRGINEVYEEFAQHELKYPELAIDEKFLLFIPLPTYFFVSPTKPELRDRIEKGLKQLIQSGEFETIFHKEFGPLIKKANLANRTTFRVSNPNLTKDDPVDNEAYWFTP